MGPDLERLKNFNGIYISPESTLKRPIAKKKPSSGADIRYKIRDLEFASAMSQDDFFFGGGGSSIDESQSAKSHTSQFSA